MVQKKSGQASRFFATTRQPDVCASAAADPSVGRPVQQSDLQPSSDQGGRTCCSGQGHVLLHIASTKAEPACCVARGPFFMTVGRKNGFCPPSWAFIPASCRLFGGAGLWCREALSLAYQNYLPSIHQLYLPVRGDTSSHKQQPCAKQGSGPFSSRRSGPAILVSRSLHNLPLFTHQNHAKSSHDSDCGSESGSEGSD